MQVHKWDKAEARTKKFLGFLQGGQSTKKDTKKATRQSGNWPEILNFRTKYLVFKAVIFRVAELQTPNIFKILRLIKFSLSLEA